MYKKLLALSLALALCVCPVFAVSDADNSYYAFDAVPYGSLGGRSLSTLAASSGWTDTDHDYLNQIRLALTSKNTGTLLSYIISIKDSVANSYDKLFYIKQNTDYLPNISNNSNSILSYLRTDLNAPAIRDSLGQIKTNTGFSKNVFDLFSSDTFSVIPYFQDSNGAVVQYWSASIPYSLGVMFSCLQHDFTWPNGETSLYGLVLRLQETLASDEDRALAEAQKSNRDQIKNDFVSGSSGKTSLGASDFGDLSSVGGSVKDSLSLNGQSSISGFTGGLSDSDSAGQGWFSAETRDALDSVSSSSSYGLKREKGNSDIYNMAGFSDHYSWLYGG